VGRRDPPKAQGVDVLYLRLMILVRLSRDEKRQVLDYVGSCRLES
jgi:hypothetical protein